MVWFYTPMALEFFPQNIETSADYLRLHGRTIHVSRRPEQFQILEKYLLKRPIWYLPAA